MTKGWSTVTGDGFVVARRDARASLMTREGWRLGGQGSGAARRALLALVVTLGSGPAPAAEALKVQVKDPSHLKLVAEFALPEVTYKVTGPVTVSGAVNGHAVGSIRCDHAGDWKLENWHLYRLRVRASLGNPANRWKSWDKVL